MDRAAPAEVASRAAAVVAALKRTRMTSVGGRLEKLLTSGDGVMAGRNFEDERYVPGPSRFEAAQPGRRSLEEVAADIARRDPDRIATPEERLVGRPAAEGEASPRRRSRKPKGDLSETKWKKVARLLPPEPRRGRHRSTDERAVVNAIRHRWETGCAWRDLPERYPPWPTVYTYFRNWLKDGTLRKLREELGPPRPSEMR